ncbi:DUF1194 domain-containing protein [Chelativorans salis]|uniref:DUF1194 domain-containing protein n=1 Tax=Chelativorans salis TaxID=2978478 RepID=A0ABT2LKZ6_9HYPH|nr:DUF1194 domain-containing protein [Chelativorans sp. EGI FJ00035]MCT7375240.1 DUF1194 domain-containing protein [Chelativorans sp. EGI FJ00035]
MSTAGWYWRKLLFGALVALVPACAHAQEAVDVELALGVDVSLSMSPAEMSIQREGYAAALTHETVIQAIEAGMHGRIAIAYFEWAGDFSHRVVVPWTVIASAEDAALVSERLNVNPPTSARRTSISGAIHFAADLFAESGFRGERRILDISGDGPNNQGPPVTEARDRLVAAGITINGLPLMTNDGLTTAYDVEDLDIYYRECVIGGPGAFMIPVNEWSHFPEAVRRKLVIELAGKTPRSLRPPVVAAQAAPSYDCMVGERMWQNRSWIWREP